MLNNQNQVNQVKLQKLTAFWQDKENIERTLYQLHQETDQLNNVALIGQALNVTWAGYCSGPGRPQGYDTTKSQQQWLMSEASWRALFMLYRFINHLNTSGLKGYVYFQGCCKHYFHKLANNLPISVLPKWY